MRKFMTAALAGLLLVSLSDDAEARPCSGGSSSQNLLLSVQHQICSIGITPYSLCHLVKDDAILLH